MVQNKNDSEGTYLTGKLLMAMPQMGDTRFHRALIYICTHNEKGAMGLVINHKLPDVDFSQLLIQLDLTSDINVNLQNLALSIMNGGPVETGRGFLLHSRDFQHNDTINVNQDFCITGTVDALREIIKGNSPEQMLFILGYAGWSPNQLESEIQQNAWLVVDADPELVFNAQHDEKWALAAKKLGIDPAMLSSVAGSA